MAADELAHGLEPAGCLKGGPQPIDLTILAVQVRQLEPIPGVGGIPIWSQLGDFGIAGWLRLLADPQDPRLPRLTGVLA